MKTSTQGPGAITRCLCGFPFKGEKSRGSNACSDKKGKHIPHDSSCTNYIYHISHGILSFIQRILGAALTSRDINRHTHKSLNCFFTRVVCS